MLDNLRNYEQIAFDLTANYLEPLCGAYARLAYLASLRDVATGKYLHVGLAETYGTEVVDQVVCHCHEEVFERLLELPLSVQGADLRRYLEVLPGDPKARVMACSKAGPKWVPPGAPSYLQDLYCSNLRVLLELFLDDTSTDRPTS